MDDLNLQNDSFSKLFDDALCAANISIDAADLESVSRQIGSPFLRDNDCIICNIIDLRQRINLIKSHMGCMAQCRGARGERLRETGAIYSLLSVTCWLISSSGNDDDCFCINLPEITEKTVQSSKAQNNNLFGVCERHSNFLQGNNNFDFTIITKKELEQTTINLAIVSLGTLRDLACGSAKNRATFLTWEPPLSQTFDGMMIENGLHVLVAYVKRYDGLSWEDILNFDASTRVYTDDMCTARGKKEIRMLTNALGAIRNSSHSNADVCQAYFACGLVDLLTWRLIENASTNINISVLPDATKPWREACYRTAGSLINLAEKCPAVATKLASNRQIIYILLETWGGANAVPFSKGKSNRRHLELPLLHLGLAAVLNAAACGVLKGGLDDIMILVLEKEKERKKVAQKREEERKLRRKIAE